LKPSGIRQFIPDMVLCALLCLVITVHFTIGFSRLGYIVWERFESHRDDAASVVTSDPCEGVRFSPADPDPALACLPPFVDPAGGLSAGDRPAGHLLFLVMFLVGMPLLIGLAVWRGRREIAAFFREPMLRMPGDRPATRREGILLAAILSMAVFFRVFMLGSWVVEESEWGAVERLPLLDLVFHGREIRHEPPLFSFLQHFVYMVNDHSLAWTRSLTCLTGIMLVVAVWRSSRMIFGPTTALLASALAAVHPFLVSNSHVMRPYSLAAFFVIMALPHAFRIGAGARRRDVVAFAVFGGLAIWTHYTTLVALACMYAYVAVGIRRLNAGRRVRDLAGAAVFHALFFLPFVPYFFSDFTDKQGGGFSPEFVSDSLAAISGLPFDLGWIPVAFPLVAGLRRARSGRFLLFVSTGFVIVVVATLWMVWWEPTHMAVLAPLMTMMVAAAAVRLKPGLAPFIVSPWLAGMALTTGLLFTLPSHSQMAWEAARPMMWHGMSYRIKADRVRQMMAEDPDLSACVDLYVTPVDQVSGFMYYWGPVTPQEIGMKPIEPNNFETFTMDMKAGSRTVRMKMTPIERMWSWEKGQWMDLEKALREKGCLWYSKSYQNCSTGTGRFFSPNDCAWLSANCKAEVSMPDGELYLCRRNHASR